MSISTRRGDSGETRLAGGVRVSKGELRVEAAGCVDELNSVMGLARACCEDPEIAGITLRIQRNLFPLGSAISNKPGGRRPVPEITEAMVKELDDIVEHFESIPGLTLDWTIPGACRQSAAFEVARTVCRRAERNVVRLNVSGEKTQPHVLQFLNRLSDVLWLCARVIDMRNGVDARLRDERHPGPPWSRAW